MNPHLFKHNQHISGLIFMIWQIFVVLHLEKAKGADSKMSAHIERTFIAGNVDESRVHLDRELVAYPEGVKSSTAYLYPCLLSLFVSCGLTQIN